MVLLCLVTLGLAKPHIVGPFMDEPSRSRELNNRSIKSMSHAHRPGLRFPESGPLSERPRQVTGGAHGRALGPVGVLCLRRQATVEAAGNLTPSDHGAGLGFHRPTLAVSAAFMPVSFLHRERHSFQARVTRPGKVFWPGVPALELTRRAKITYNRLRRPFNESPRAVATPGRMIGGDRYDFLADKAPRNRAFCQVIRGWRSLVTSGESEYHELLASDSSCPSGGGVGEIEGIA